jgi:S-formylglutathione hydrolase FrmB
MQPRLRHLLFALLIGSAAVAQALASAAPAAAAAGTIYQSSFRSTALGGTIHYGVYLPPGYATSGKRYPVIYFLHGLPSRETAYRKIGWIADAVEQSGHQAIVIGAQGTRGNDIDPEWLDRGPGEKWETATAGELVSVVDSRYRTFHSRYGRAIIGFSAGGYGATLIGFHHPDEYSVIQSWSGYFRPTNIEGTAVLDLGSKKANDHASMYAIAQHLHSVLGANYTHTHFGFYVGQSDSRFRSDNEHLHQVLTQSGLPHLAFGISPGGHEGSLWQRHAPPWIALATGLLRRAR